MSYRRNSWLSVNPIWVLIAVNVVIFIATNINPGQIYGTFALDRTSLVTLPWTALTYMFVHASFWHLLLNMLTLYFFGTYVIMLVGEAGFLLTYFLGGIAGGLLFVLLDPVSEVVGASGAIYALGGLLLVMRPTTRVMIIPLPIPMPLWVAILIGFVLLIAPGIAWQAHLGGLILGAVIGFYYRRRERRRYYR